MRFEGKTEEDAVSTALKTLKRPAAELSYTVIRDEKSFWGGRVVEIEVGSVEDAAVAADAAAAEQRLDVVTDQLENHLGRARVAADLDEKPGG